MTPTEIQEALFTSLPKFKSSDTVTMLQQLERCRNLDPQSTFLNQTLDWATQRITVLETPPLEPLELPRTPSIDVSPYQLLRDDPTIQLIGRGGKPDRLDTYRFPNNSYVSYGSFSSQKIEPDHQLWWGYDAHEDDFIYCITPRPHVRWEHIFLMLQGVKIPSSTPAKLYIHPVTLDALLWVPSETITPEDMGETINLLQDLELTRFGMSHIPPSHPLWIHVSLKPNGFSNPCSPSVSLYDWSF